MIDVDKVIDGTFIADTASKCMEAYVAAAQLVNRGKKAEGSAFGYVVGFGRRILEACRIDPPESSTVMYYHVASAEFKRLMVSAAAAGEIAGYDVKTELNTFKQAVREVTRVMLNGVPVADGDGGEVHPLLAVEDASGAFVLGSKSKIQAWNKQHEEDTEGALIEAAAAHARANKAEPTEVQSAETTPGVGLEDVQSSILRDEIAELIAVCVTFEGIKEKCGTDRNEDGLEKIVRSVKGWKKSASQMLAQDFADAIAAANDPEGADEEAA